MAVLGIGGTAAIFTSTRPHHRTTGVHLALSPAPSVTSTTTTTVAPPTPAASTVVSSPPPAAERPEQAPPISGPSPTVAATLTDLRWRPAGLAVAGTGPATGLAAVAAVPGQGYVAVGTADDGPLVVASVDGQQWQRLVPTDGALAGGLLRDVAVDDNAVVVVGSAAGRPAAWRSTDGVRWRSVSVEGSGNGTLEAVTVDRDLGPVAAGFSPAAAGIWRLEGGAFRAVTSLPGGNDKGRLFNDVVATGGAVVAVGNNGNGQAVAWTWRGGERWTGAVLADHASAEAAAVVGDAVDVVGYDEGGARVWRSTEGASWPTVATLSARGASIMAPLGVAVAGDRVLAVGQDGSRPLCWLATASDWRPCTSPDTGLARDIVAVGNSFLAVGRSEGAAAGPAAWIVESNQQR